MIQSPLNYTVGKFKLLPQILPCFPDDIDCFIDLFCGGCNVGINVSAKNYIYSDSSKPLIDLYNTMLSMDSKQFIDKVEKIISGYHLSDVKRKGYEFYNCKSSDGLGAYNKEKYLKLREDFNAQTSKIDDYYIMLYVLIVYAFNNQIRFNKSGEFNLPVGKRDFNQKMYNKLEKFISVIKQQNAVFIHNDFRSINIEMLNYKDFVYIDPPYLITCASYNEQGGWDEDDEMDLLNLLDKLSEKKIRFALSNVLESKGKENIILKNWLEKRPKYTVKELDYTYSNSNYQRTNKKIKTREILVTSY